MYQVERSWMHVKASPKRNKRPRRDVWGNKQLGPSRARHERDAKGASTASRMERIENRRSDPPRDAKDHVSSSYLSPLLGYLKKKLDFFDSVPCSASSIQIFDYLRTISTRSTFKSAVASYSQGIHQVLHFLFKLHWSVVGFSDHRRKPP